METQESEAAEAQEMGAASNKGVAARCRSMGSPGGAVVGQGEVEGAGGSTQAKGAVLAKFEDDAFGQ